MVAAPYIYPYRSPIILWRITDELPALLTSDLPYHKHAQVDPWALNSDATPVSDEFIEVSALDGKLSMVQYFERALFELHPENQPPFDVLLSSLALSSTGQNRERGSVVWSLTRYVLSKNSVVYYGTIH